MFDSPCSGAVQLEGAPFRCLRNSWLGTPAPGQSLQVRQTSSYALCSLSFPHSERRTTFASTTAWTRLEISFCSSGAPFVELAAATLDDTPLFALNNHVSGVIFEWETFVTGVCPEGCSTCAMFAVVHLGGLYFSRGSPSPVSSTAHHESVIVREVVVTAGC